MASRQADVRLDGDKELEAALRGLIGKDARSAMKQGLRDACRTIVLPKAKALAQANFGHRKELPPGAQRLADSLKVKPTKSRRGVFGYGVKTGTRAELGIDPDDKHFYPNALEYGFHHRNANRRIPARPYMRPALWEQVDRIMRTFGDGTRRKLEFIFNKYGRRTR